MMRFRCCLLRGCFKSRALFLKTVSVAFERAVHRFNHLVSKCQSESHAFVFSGEVFFGLCKDIQHFLNLLFVNARPLIDHGDYNDLVVFLDNHADAFLVGKFDGILMSFDTERFR